jgi:Fe-S oxidoreductase
VSETPGSLREQLDRAVPDWLEEVEATEPETTRSESIDAVRSLGALLRREADRRFVTRAGEADVDPADVEVVVHMGCHSIKTPVVIDSLMDVLGKLDFEAVALGGYNNCCGIEDMKRGDIETAEALDDNRFGNISALDPDYAVAECSSCHSITETASLGYREPEFEFPFMPEFLLDHRERLLDAVEVTDPVAVTVHDHYDYRGWMPDEQMEFVRDLFRALPGVEVVEMEHTKSDRLPCALSASPDDHPYDDINARIYREAEAADADVLVNVWHACHRCLLPQEHEFEPVTLNYATFLAERLGFDYRDGNREYLRLAREEGLDAVVEAARPVFEANGLSEERARRVVESHYWPSA